MEEDLLLAVRLQEQFDREVRDRDRDREAAKRPRLEPDRPLSIVDASWEVLDPNPDVRALFLEFNRRFFWGKLSGVEVKWSPRMTLCAGVCSYEGRGGLCSIRLSEPLLKLRPRKDLVETLLHEMIHALLFVTQNNRDRDGHGPEFCKHMNRINQESGTRITVYHSFHDEVDVYRQHWWRCDGPCRNRRPYFGWVKRAMNRAPSSLDPWWEDHLRTCGGSYTKVKEPEGYSSKKGGKKKKKKKEEEDEQKKDKTGGRTSTADSGSQDIRNVIPFSGTGFVLGGNYSSCGMLSSSLVSSPRSCSPSSSSSSSTSPSLTWSSSAGGRPPGKISVGNTRAFISINGSPMKIPKHQRHSAPVDRSKQKSIQELFGHQSVGNQTSQRVGGDVSSPQVRPQGSSAATDQSQQKKNRELFSKSSVKNPMSRPDTSRASSAGTNVGSSQVLSQSSPSRLHSSSATAGPSKQKSIQELFNRSIVRSSTSRPDAKKDSTLPKLGLDRPLSRSSGPTQSTYFRDSHSQTTSGGPASRKRLWDEANVSDFFRNPPESDSRDSSGTHATSSSSSSLMVSCPVCQVKVQESKINEHLDSCLS